MGSSTRTTRLLAGIGLVLVGLLAGILVMLVVDDAPEEPTVARIVERVEAGVRAGSTRTAVAPANWSEEGPPPATLNRMFRDVARSVTPGVVSIRVASGDGEESGGDTPFGPPAQGLGSGVLISPDGYVVTNNHVVEGAERIRVRLADKRQFEARLVGTDASTDLAVVKIDAENDVPVVPFGNSDRVQVGDWVVAVGNPLQLTSTVTAGIVSALGRQLSIIEDQFRIENFIQTDAAINPGNSGGPLVNLSGQLVGINTAIASNTGGYQGIGFAIPVNTVERVATQIIEEGEVRRAFLGIEYDSAPMSLIENEELPKGSVIVRTVEDGTAAAEAGLQSGDVITAVDGQSLQETLQIANLIASKAPGDEVSLNVLKRSGNKETITVTLGSRDSGMTASADQPSSDEMMKELGIGVQNVTPEIARRLGMDEARGVVITEVDRSNPSIRDSGLRPRQVILQMAGQAINNVEQFRKVYAGIPAGEAFRLVVQNRGFVAQTSLRKPAE